MTDYQQQSQEQDLCNQPFITDASKLQTKSSHLNNQPDSPKAKLAYQEIQASKFNKKDSSARIVNGSASQVQNQEQKQLEEYHIPTIFQVWDANTSIKRLNFQKEKSSRIPLGMNCVELQQSNLLQAKSPPNWANIKPVYYLSSSKSLLHTHLQQKNIEYPSQEAVNNNSQSNTPIWGVTPVSQNRNNNASNLSFNQALQKHKSFVTSPTSALNTTTLFSSNRPNQLNSGRVGSIDRVLNSSQTPQNRGAYVISNFNSKKQAYSNTTSRPMTHGNAFNNKTRQIAQPPPPQTAPNSNNNLRQFSSGQSRRFQRLALKGQKASTIMANSFNFFPVHSSSNWLNDINSESASTGIGMFNSKNSNSSMMFFGHRKSKKKTNDNETNYKRNMGILDELKKTLNIMNEEQQATVNEKLKSSMNKFKLNATSQQLQSQMYSNINNSKMNNSSLQINVGDSQTVQYRYPSSPAVRINYSKNSNKKQQQSDICYLLQQANQPQEQTSKLQTLQKLQKQVDRTGKRLLYESVDNRISRLIYKNKKRLSINNLDSKKRGKQLLSQQNFDQVHSSQVIRQNDFEYKVRKALMERESKQQDKIFMESIKFMGKCKIEIDQIKSKSENFLIQRQQNWERAQYLQTLSSSQSQRELSPDANLDMDQRVIGSNDQNRSGIQLAGKIFTRRVPTRRPNKHNSFLKKRQKPRDLKGINNVLQELMIKLLSQSPEQRALKDMENYIYDIKDLSKLLRSYMRVVTPMLNSSQPLQTIEILWKIIILYFQFVLGGVDQHLKQGTAEIKKQCQIIIEEYDEHISDLQDNFRRQQIKYRSQIKTLNNSLKLITQDKESFQKLLQERDQIIKQLADKCNEEGLLGLDSNLFKSRTSGIQQGDTHQDIQKGASIMDFRDKGAKVKGTKNTAEKNQNADDGDKRQGNESRTSWRSKSSRKQQLSPSDLGFATPVPGTSQALKQHVHHQETDQDDQQYRVKKKRRIKNYSDEQQEENQQLFDQNGKRVKLKKRASRKNRKKQQNSSAQEDEEYSESDGKGGWIIKKRPKLKKDKKRRNNNQQQSQSGDITPGDSSANQIKKGKKKLRKKTRKTRKVLNSQGELEEQITLTNSSNEYNSQEQKQGVGQLYDSPNINNRAKSTASKQKKRISSQTNLNQDDQAYNYNSKQQEKIVCSLNKSTQTEQLHRQRREKQVQDEDQYNDFLKKINKPKMSQRNSDSISSPGSTKTLAKPNPLKVLLSKAGKQEKVSMPQANVIRILQNAMEDKLKAELQGLPNKAASFPVFISDFLIMQYGLKTIAVKNLQSIQQGLKLALKRKFKYAKVFQRILGLGNQPQFSNLQISIILRAKLLFEEVQAQWRSRTLDRQRDQNFYNNLNTGGEVPVTELIDGIYRASLIQKQSMQSLIVNLYPDTYYELNNQEERKNFQLDFSIVKMCARIFKMGKDRTYIFEILDKSRSGTISYAEFFSGLKSNFNVFFTDNEIEQMCIFLDTDGDGEITWKQFSNKINFSGFAKRIESMMISKVLFIQKVLERWENYKQQLVPHFEELFDKYDTNKDSVLSFDQQEYLLSINLLLLRFEAMFGQHGSKKTPKAEIVKIFVKTLQASKHQTGGGDDQNLQDKMSKKAFCNMAFQQKLDGKGKVFFDEWTKNYIQSMGANGQKGQSSPKKTSPTKSSPSISPKRRSSRNSILVRF